jgi:apolipoprotein N-acyltransferase
MHVYRLRTSFKIFGVFGLAFYLFVVSGVAVSIAQGQGDGGGRIFFAIWLPASLAFIGYWLWATPIEIRIEDDRIVVFRSLWRSVPVPVADIESVEGTRWDFSGQYATVRHSSGKVRMLTVYDNFHDFLSTLQRINPAIQIRRL